MVPKLCGFFNGKVFHYVSDLSGLFGASTQRNKPKTAQNSLETLQTRQYSATICRKQAFHIYRILIEYFSAMPRRRHRNHHRTRRVVRSQSTDPTLGWTANTR